MKRPLLTYFLIILLAILIGCGTALLRIKFWDDSSATLKNGPWMGRKEMELGEDLLLTARVATQATFALKSSEVLYFVAREDSDGNPLDARYEYLINGSGNALDARYWSITMYGSDFLLVPNEKEVWGYNLATVVYADSTKDAFEIELGPASDSGTNLLPTPEKGPFYLLLRMYHPDQSVYQNPEGVKLPVIRRVEK